MWPSRNSARLAPGQGRIGFGEADFLGRTGVLDEQRRFGADLEQECAAVEVHYGVLGPGRQVVQLDAGERVAAQRLPEDEHGLGLLQQRASRRTGGQVADVMEPGERRQAEATS